MHSQGVEKRSTSLYFFARAILNIIIIPMNKRFLNISQSAQIFSDFFSFRNTVLPKKSKVDG